MRVLHILPDKLLLPKHRYLGSTKYIRGRTEYFADREIQVDELAVEGRSDGFLLPLLKKMDLRQYDTAVFEFPVYPRSMKYFKSAAPRTSLQIYSQNAEFFHRLHYSRARLHRQVEPKKAVDDFSESFRRLWLEYACARLADWVLTISPWEANHYWKYVSSPQKVLVVPYFLPRTYAADLRQTDCEKTFSCVCLTSTTKGTLPFIKDAVLNFSGLVGKLKGDLPHWSFAVTGGISRKTFNLDQRLQATDFLESPFDILKSARAVALLSDYGYGFKTKIIESIVAGCWILVTPGLFRRIPAEVKPYCKVVQPGSKTSFADALAQCEEAPPHTKVNEILRSQAFDSMDAVFLKR